MENLPSPAPAALRTSRVKWTFLFSFLALLATLDTLHDYIARAADGTAPALAVQLMWTVVYWGPYFILVPAAVLVMDRYRLKFVRPRSFVIHAIAGLLFTYIHVAIYALPSAPPQTGFRPDYWERYFQLLKIDFAIAYSVYFAIVVSAYMVQQYADLREGEMRASRLETNLAQTRLRAIEAQLNPHFFFNTLQGISVLALAGERTEVAESLGRLSNLLRVMFDQKRPAQILVATELDFINSYLDLHRLSFDERLEIVRDIQPETLDAKVPAMLLQPLVENSIVHGLAIKPGRGVIRIATRKVNQHLVLEVEDSGPGFRNPAPSRRGVGLSATESRLQLLFGAEHSIEYGASQLGGARVRIVLPFLLASMQMPSTVASGEAA